MDDKQIRRWTKSEVDAAIRTLRQFYDEGAQYLLQGRPYASSGTASEKEQRAKAKAFANPFTGYTRQELNQLLAACAKQHWAPTRAHMIRLLTIQKGPHRRELQDKVFANRWSTVQLNLALRDQFGNRRPKAGRMRNMDNWNDAKTLLLKFAEQWQRLHAAIQAKSRQPDDSGTSTGFSPPVSPAVEKKLQSVDQALLDLKQLLQRPAKKKPTRQ